MKKRKPSRIFKIIAITLVAVLAALLTLFYIASSFLSNDQKTLKAFDEDGICVYESYIPFGDGLARIIQVGDTTLPNLLMIHGSPGSWSDFKTVLKDEALRAKYCIVSYDRPGYGKTTLPAQPSLRKQAELAKAVMDRVADSTGLFDVLGYSYGGGVLQEILLDYPQMVNKAIYIAPTLSPDLQQPKWYNTAASLVYYLLHPIWKASNTEMYGLPKSLQANDLRIGQINTPTVFVHGTDDTIVPFATVAYYQGHRVPNVEYIIEKRMGHGVPWSHPYLILQAILGPE